MLAIMSSMSNVPVTVPLHAAVGIEPFGSVIVKVPVFPFIVPDTLIVVPAWKPENVTVPVKALPVWVSCQFIDPTDPIIPMPDAMDIPIVVPLESDAVPTQVPVATDVPVEVELLGVDATAVGLVGFDALAAQAVNPTARIKTIERCQKRIGGSNSAASQARRRLLSQIPDATIPLHRLRPNCSHFAENDAGKPSLPLP